MLIANYFFIILSVRLLANYADQRVFVQQIGVHSSGLNGFKTEKDVKIVAQHNDRLEILYGKYPYVIEFNPPPARAIFVPKEKKRIHESDSEYNDECQDKKVKREGSFDSNEDSLNISLSGSCSDSQENYLFESKNNFKMPVNLKEKESVSEPSGNSKPADKEIWEEFGRGTCLVYTSKRVEGRSKVSFEN